METPDKNKLVNGKYYPLWQQFVDRKKEWIGGILEEFVNPKYKAITEIVDITLEPNGEDSAYFEIKGKDFNCSSDVEYLGILPIGEDGWLTLSGYGGQTWRIKKNNGSNKQSK